GLSIPLAIFRDLFCRQQAGLLVDLQYGVEQQRHHHHDDDHGDDDVHGDASYAISWMVKPENIVPPPTAKLPPVTPLITKAPPPLPPMRSFSVVGAIATLGMTARSGDGTGAVRHGTAPQLSRRSDLWPRDRS